MEQEKPTKSPNRGEFFAVCMEAVRDIVKAGGRAEEVISYMVLARHTQGKGKYKYMLSTAGATAIANKAGITWRSAKKVLGWLSQAENGRRAFIFNRDNETLPDDMPRNLGEGKSRNTEIRWVLNWLSEDTENHLYLAHSLFEGIGAGKRNPPLHRIMEDIPLPSDMSASHKEAKLDSVMLLLHLYQHHDIAECGGVDPSVGVYREWEHSTLPEVLEGYDLPFGLQEVTKAQNSMFIKFAEEALFYVEDEALRNKRFWYAFNNLHTLGFVYEVLEIWDSNPLESSMAELLYPLYVFDRHARESEPFLAYNIHDVLIQPERIDGFAVGNLFDEINFFKESGSHSFRYAIPKQGAYPLSVYRLRFRPKTRDSGRGISAEKRRHADWLSAINSAAYQE